MEQSNLLHAWGNNTNVNKCSFSPMQLQVGKSIVVPGFTEGTVVTDSDFEGDLAEKFITNMKEVVKAFKVENYRTKIDECVYK